MNLSEMTTEALEQNLLDYVKEEGVVDMKFDVVPGSDYRETLKCVVGILRGEYPTTDVSDQTL